MQSCIAVDWLQLFVKVPPGSFGEIKAAGYGIQRQLYGSRHFAEIYTITDAEGAEIAVLACRPHSNILDKDGGLLKFVNCQLYRGNLRAFVECALFCLKLEFVSISRMDIAVDFEKFDRGLNPENLIRGFVQGKFVKCGRQANFKLQGDTGKGCAEWELDAFTPETEACKAPKAAPKSHFQTWAPRFHYLKFGSEKSDVSYYLYNKSVEMAQVKEKPWIRDHWISNGYDGKADVWRLEFSVKNNNKAILHNGGAAITMKSLDAIEDENILLIWAHYFNEHFTWHRNNGASRKDRMPRLALLSDLRFQSVKIELSRKKEAGKSAKIFAGMLMKVNQELRGHDAQLGIYGDDYLRHFLHSRGLQSWAERKHKKEWQRLPERARNPIMDGIGYYEPSLKMAEQINIQFEAQTRARQAFHAANISNHIDLSALRKWGWKW